MEIFANFYGMILGLIKSLLDIFGVDTSVVDGLIADLDEVQKENPEA